MDQSLNSSEPFRHGSFAGQTCVVTGGSQGLGYATAELMKARGAASILLVGRDQAKGDAAAASLDGDGCAVSFLSADIGSTDGVDTPARRVPDQHRHGLYVPAGSRKLESGHERHASVLHAPCARHARVRTGVQKRLDHLPAGTLDARQVQRREPIGAVDSVDIGARSD